MARFASKKLSSAARRPWPRGCRASCRRARAASIISASALDDFARGGVALRGASQKGLIFGRECGLEPLEEARIIRRARDVALDRAAASRRLPAATFAVRATAAAAGLGIARFMQDRSSRGTSRPARRGSKARTAACSCRGVCSTGPSRQCSPTSIAPNYAYSPRRPNSRVSAEASAAGVCLTLIAAAGRRRRVAGERAATKFVGVNAPSALTSVAQPLEAPFEIGLEVAGILKADIEPQGGTRRIPAVAVR